MGAQQPSRWPRCVALGGASVSFLWEEEVSMDSEGHRAAAG